MSVTEKPAKLWSFGFIFLLIVGFVNLGAFGIGIPIFPGYSISLGATLSVAGTVTGIFSAVALFGRPFTSVMVDRLNKKHLLVISLILSGIATILYAFAPSLSWVLPIRFFHALMFSISGTVSFALGAEYIPKERMGEGIGYMGIGQILGMAIGPNVGILIAEHHSYQLSFGVSGVVIAISGLMVFALRYKPGTPYNSKASNKSCSGENKALRLKDFLAIELIPNALFAAVFMLGNGLIMSFLVLMGEERGIEGVGLYFIVYAVVVLLTRPFAGKLTDRKGAAFVIIPGYIFTAGAMLLIGMSYNVWPIMLAAVLFSIGAGVAMPAIQADCLLKLDRSRSGVATGTYFIGLDIGMTIGPIVGGIVASSFGFAATFYSAATLMVVGFCVYLLYVKLKED